MMDYVPNAFADSQKDCVYTQSFYCYNHPYYYQRFS